MSLDFPHGLVANACFYASTVVSRIYCSNASPVRPKTSVKLRSLRMRWITIATFTETTNSHQHEFVCCLL